jgi:cephalosporin-C deacetylase
MFLDLPLNQLRAYLPARDEPADFDRFWEQTLGETRQSPLDARFEPADFGLALLDTFDVTYNGFGGQPVKGWLVLPRSVPGPLPCIVEFVGYGGGRSIPIDRLLWGCTGYAHFIMDTRGQGSSWSTGDTPDPEPADSNPHHPGFMTRGILDPQNYYYRRVFADGVRAVEAARLFSKVDADRVAVMGGSQGGGITLAVAGLVPDLSAVMPDVPFLCHYRVATEITDSYPYQEITRYCQTHRDKVETVFSTLSYFDGLNFAARARGSALFSVGLMDEICPPRTVFAAYNHYAGEKDIKVWSYNHHEGGGVFQDIEKMAFLARLWKQS